MAVASKTWVVGEIVSAANMNTYMRDNDADLQANKTSLEIATGSYAGDGAASKPITGIGQAPVYAKIYRQEADGAAWTYWETWDVVMSRDPQGLAGQISNSSHSMQDDKIISLDSDGFTVSDAGSDQDPNKTGEDYDWVTLGSIV